MAPRAKGVKKAIEKAAKSASKKVDDIADIGLKALDGLDGPARQTAQLELIQKKGGNLYNRVHRNADGKLELAPQDFSINDAGSGQKGHKNRVTKEEYEARVAKEQAAADKRDRRAQRRREAEQIDRAQQGGGIYDRVYRGEDGKLHLEKQDFSIDSSGTGQKGRNHLTKEEWEAKKKQKEIDDKKALEDKVYKDIRAREARIDEVNALNRPMQKRTLGEKAKEVISGTGDESRRFAGRNTRQANMEKANADINAANQVYMDTGEGSAQRLHDKKSYWAEVKGKGKQTPPSDTKLGQGGTTAPNGTNPADIAGENATNGFNFDGIADWAKENQLIVAGGLVAGTLLLTDD
jgi:hypothetical protein